MRANVVGVEAVLGTGAQVSHLDGLVKDNTGYDLAGLLCGSEGTLGVITALRLRLVPRWPDRCALWVACHSWEDALALATRARLEIDGLDGLEAVDAAALALVQSELGLPPLFAPIPEVALLVVWAGWGDPPESLGLLVADHDHVVAQDGPAWRAFWAYRERVTEAVARKGIPKKFDVTLPLRRLAEFIHRVSDALGQHRLVLFGHLGDGNLHVNLPAAGDDDLALDDAILRLVADCGGSISAEHGIGRHKAPWLHLNRSDAERETFRILKAALDPAGVMNPGVLFAE
jgi:FAD/FMN-containing dehydrogenase